MDSRDSRVEVIRNGHTLLLKGQDVTISQLARILKIKPETLYLEEEVTNNVELADTDGRFHASARNTGIRYKVCGENETSIGESSNTVRQVWSTPPSWTVPTRGRSSAPLESPKRNISEQSSSGVAESTFKKCIPFVSLVLDGSGKIVIESTDDNVYIKIPGTVSTESILSAIAPKVSMVADDLIVLDSKFIPVTNDKDMEYWKTPSRRLYVTRHKDFEEIIVEQKDLKRLNLSLTRKRKASHHIETEECSDTLARIETTVEIISDTVKKLSNPKSQLTAVALQQFECKICLCLSRPPVMTTLCCHQLLGCEICFKAATEDDLRCPLCRHEDTTAIPLRGFDAIIKELQKEQQAE